MSRTHIAPYDTSNSSGAHVTAGFQYLLRVGDLVVILLAIIVNHLVGLDGGGFLVASRAGRILPNDVLLDIGFGLSWWFLLAAMSSYRERLLGYGPEEYHRVLQASAIEFGSLALLSYLSGAQLPRAYFLVALPVGVALLITWRWGARQFFIRARRRGAFTHPAFVVGSRESASAVIAAISRRPELGLRPCGAFLSDADPFRYDAQRLPVPVIGGVEDLDRVVDGAGEITLLITPASGLTPPAVRRIGRSMGTTSRLLMVHSFLDVSGLRR